MMSVDLNACNDDLFHKRRAAVFAQTKWVSSGSKLLTHTAVGISFKISKSLCMLYSLIFRKLFAMEIFLLNDQPDNVEIKAI
mmetsp:Transcript_60300/g.126198  ORF Transcript_60300/g.126198 Transcript_60300/m.126198 type:complete len:82 (-) Transcript_60300:57-302(-)